MCFEESHGQDILILAHQTILALIFLFNAVINETNLRKLIKVKAKLLLPFFTTKVTVIWMYNFVLYIFHFFIIMYDARTGAMDFQNSHICGQNHSWSYKT